MVQKMAFTNQTLPAQTATTEHNCQCYRLPLLAAAITSKRREMATLPPAEPQQIEICLSPLLWSESFGLVVDG